MTFNQYHTQIKQDERYQKLNFSPDGRDHYVYRVTDYTRTDKQHYYGSHTPPKSKKYKSLIDEFWTYRTSSNKNVLNENVKDNYKVKILKVFDNSAMKMIYESYLHQYFNVKLSNSFWNGSNQTPFGFDTTGKEAPNKNKTMSEVSKEKLAISKSKINPITGLNGYQQTGINSANTRKKINPNTGMSIDQENSLKLKKVLSTINPETNLTPTQMSMQKLAVSRLKADPVSGLTMDQIRGINSANTRKKINPDTGMSIDQENGLKISNTRKKINPNTGMSNYEECGKKLSEKLNYINPETGIRYADELGEKRRTYYNVYHISEGLILSNIATSDLPFSKNNNSKQNYFGKTVQSINAMKTESKKYI